MRRARRFFLDDFDDDMGRSLRIVAHIGVSTKLGEVQYDHSFSAVPELSVRRWPSALTQCTNWSLRLRVECRFSL
jgi:hypothetical protein